MALILVMVALQLLAPGEKVETTDSSSGHILFSVDQRMVLAPGACVIVRWQVDHIQAVYINGEPTVGAGSKQLCVDAQTMPVLRVEYEDQRSSEYPLEIQFLAEQPSTWFLISAEVLLGVLSLVVAFSHSSSAASPMTGRRTPRITFIFAGIGVIVSVVTLLALVAELGLRLYFGQLGTQAEQSTYLEVRDQVEAHQSEIALPFIEYGLSPDFPGHNPLGYRGDDIHVPKPEGVYRIVVLGDSSTYGSYVPYDKTYPYDLQQILRQDYGAKNVEVVNAGVPNYTSWNMLVDLAFRVAALQPDLVIVYEGWNDLDAREKSPDCYSAPSPFLGLDPNRQLRAEPADLSASALYRLLAIDFGWMRNPAQSEGSFIDSSSSCTAEDTSKLAQNIQANPPIYFERNMGEMIGIAKALGVRIMFMTWAYDANISYFPAFRRPGIAEHNAISAGRTGRRNAFL